MIGFLVCGFSMVSHASGCHPPINFHKKQYIVGYGSLMLEESKLDTSSHLQPNIPVIVRHYKRGWFARGKMKKNSCTFLGFKKNYHHFLNAVIFEVDSSDLQLFDMREKGYCRQLVHQNEIKPLSKTSPRAKDSQAWIYVPSRRITHLPSADFPILKPYADLFLKGCYQVEKKHHIKSFYQNCLVTTFDWQDMKNP